MLSYRAVWRPARSWLSLTPEPECELPAAIAALRAGGEPGPAELERERARAERLVVRGSRRRWSRWLADTRALAEAGAAGHAEERAVADARDAALDVISNHEALKLGLARRAGRGGRGGRGR
jgi:hypothetical protein